jgi:hypothetical protein
LLVQKKLSKMIKYLFISVVISLPQLYWLYAPVAGNIHSVESAFFHPWLTNLNPMIIVRYVIDNFGILPVIVGAGLMAMKKEIRIILIPFLVLIIGPFIPGLGIEVTHKFINLWVLIAGIIAAYVVYILLNKGNIYRIFGLIVIGFLTLSGVINLPIIKNEFPYPAADKSTYELIEWMRLNTPKNAVFISYANVFDPVVMSGRKNFLGWYRRAAAESVREPIVKQVYENPNDSISKILKENKVTYIISPEIKIDGFDYKVNNELIGKYYSRVYKNNNFTVFANSNNKE